jgi:hypothetical protein
MHPARAPVLVPAWFLVYIPFAPGLFCSCAIIQLDRSLLSMQYIYYERSTEYLLGCAIRGRGRRGFFFFFFFFFWRSFPTVPLR